MYAISYDDQKTLSQFSEEQKIPYPLLSDLDSAVIRRFGILNDRIKPGDLFLYGIPFPGSFVVNAEGIVVAKFFHDSYKKRDSPELLIDAALGKVVLSDDAPSAAGGGDEVRISATVHGGKGTIRQGIRREIVVRFELDSGLHIYGEPVPQGMVPVSIAVSGPPGLVVEDTIAPPTTPLKLSELGVELQVWSGVVDLCVPIYPTGELASEVRPLDFDSVPIQVEVRYQACNDQTCLLPTTETLRLDVPLDVVDVPRLSFHGDHGQRVASYDGTRQLLRLARRKILWHPLGLLRFVARVIRLELAAWRRARG